MSVVEPKHDFDGQGMGLSKSKGGVRVRSSDMN